MIVGAGPDLLNPNACVAGLPHGAVPLAGRGNVLGDHVNEADVGLQCANGGAVKAGSCMVDALGRHFQPYENNGGTVAAISGKDYTIVASDTRLGHNYSIPTRFVSRVIQLTDRVVLASSGMQSDIAILHKMLRIRLKQYWFNHQKEMTLTSISQMLATILYYRRFQPYYAFNVLGGLDENGEGWSYSYDAIGSHEKVRAVCSGTGTALLQPVLDNQVEGKQLAHGQAKQELSVDECLDLVKDGFTSTCERDIYTGDSVELFKITSSGVERHTLELRAD